MARQRESFLGCLVRVVFQVFSIALIIGLYTLLGMHFYAWVIVVCPLLKKRLGTEFGMLWAGIGLIFLYNIVFNHVLAMLIKPGSTFDQKVVERMRTRDKQRANRKSIERDLDDDFEDRFYGLSKEVKQLLRYRAKTFDNLKEFWTKKCDTCDEIKPARSHHCSVCGKCVFLMDHHCPWLNNCVGLENSRYFLLFCFYLMMGCGYMAVTFTSLYHHHLYEEHKQLMNFLFILDVVLFIAMGAFSGWNWFLACIGTTTIEFWKGEGTGLYKDEAKLRFDNISDNLYRIFGTYTIIRILSPSMRNVPFTGLEWSFFFRDAGYDCDGLKPDPAELAASKDDETSGLANKNFSQVMTEDDVELSQITGLTDVDQSSLV